MVWKIINLHREINYGTSEKVFTTLITDIFFQDVLFGSVCGAANIVTASLFCGSRGARYSSAAGPSTSYVSGSNSLTFEEFVKQRANAGDQTFFNCAVKKAEKEKQVEKKLGGKNWAGMIIQQ